MVHEDSCKCDHNVNQIQILHLTSGHRALDTRIFWKECISLSEAGYDVMLICQDAEKNECKKYKGVKLLSLKRPKSRLERFVTGNFRLLKSALRSKAKIVHFHDPDLIITGIILAMLGRKVVYDVHENYQDSLQNRKYMPFIIKKIVIWLVSFFEWASKYCFAGYVAADVQIARKFSRNKSVIIRNYPILQQWDSLTNKSTILSGIYVGEISEERGALTLLKSIEIYAKKYNDDINISLVGPISDQIKQRFEKSPVAHLFEIHGYVPHSKIPSLYQQADFGICVLHPTKAYKEAIPVKFMEYLAASLPIIVSDFPRLKRFERVEQACVFVDPLNSSEIAAAIHKLAGEKASQFKKRRQLARSIATNYFNWENEAERLRAFYKRFTKL